MNDSPAVAGPARRPRLWLALAVLVATLIAATVAAVWLRSNVASPPVASRAVGDPPGTPILATPALEGITGVFIEPGDGRAPLLEEIAAARQSVDLEVYIVTDEVILDALEDAQRRGIAVRVILEQHPFGGDGGQPEIFARLERAGIAVRWSNPVFRFTHIKTMVVDDAVAIIMNQNLTASAFTGNREFGVVTTQPDAVRTAAAIFEADWARAPEPASGPLVVSPTNARPELLGLVTSAETSLDVYAEVLADRQLLDAFAAAARRGVHVRVIVTPAPDNAAARANLAAAGVEVRLMTSLYVHAKLIVADDRRAYVGSQNLSATSLDLNRELGIIVDDPASLARLTRTFALDFQTSAPQAAP